MCVHVRSERHRQSSGDILPGRCLEAEAPIHTIGDALRAHRRAMSLSQEELAERAGMSVRNLRAIEVGQVRTPRQRTVRLLAEALGLTPAQRLRFYALARCGEATSAPTTSWAGSEAAPARPVPAQLPADVNLVGRGDPLAQLDRILAGRRSRAVTTIAIIGPAGIGKTSLAVHWAHRVRHRFPGGQLFVDLRGFDPRQPPLAAGLASAAFLDALGVPAPSMPADDIGRTGLLRSLLINRRMLLVLDNAQDSEQVRPLLLGGAGCLVLVTSRDRLVGLVAGNSAHSVELGPLTAEASRQLLAGRTGPPRTAADSAAVDVITEACGGLPLALTVAAARITSRASTPLQTVAQELTRPGNRLDGFASRDTATDLRSCLDGSYQLLSEPAARLFRLLGLHPGPATAVAAASLAGVSLYRAYPLLTELHQANLLTEQGDARYHQHDLIAAYAADLVRRDDQPSRHAGLRRLCDHYLRTSIAGARLLEPRRELPVVRTPSAGTVVLALAGAEDARNWFVAHHSTLLAMVRLAEVHGLATLAWQLAWALTSFLSRGGHWADQLAVHRVALRAARTDADLLGMSYAYRGMSRAYLRLGQPDAAEDVLLRALSLAAELGDQIGRARVHHGLSVAAEQRDDLRLALDRCRRSAAIFGALGDTCARAEVLNGAGWLNLLAGHVPRAMRQIRTALVLLRRFGERHGEASAWDSLGCAYAALGHREAADNCFRRALDLFLDLDDRYFQAEALVHLGDNRWDTGDWAAARKHWQRATHILTELHHPKTAGVRYRLACADGDRLASLYGLPGVGARRGVRRDLRRRRRRRRWHLRQPTDGRGSSG
ncbi:ATP-binding protein [Micromonospora sp. NPDC093277]|uniref:ATP-binding protein n=1 Tax=Micromonospora sp. NPDC093277 TaxID=3364291 RepID=UPI003800C2D7